MQINPPNQVHPDISKLSLRELASINSARLSVWSNSSDSTTWTQEHIDFLNQLVDNISFFEMIYKLILDRNVTIPVHIIRTIFVVNFLIALFALIKIFMRDNFHFQYSIDIVFLCISLITIAIIVRFNKYIYINNSREEECNRYLSDLNQIKCKIIFQLNNPISRKNPEYFINDVCNDIESLKEIKISS